MRRILYTLALSLAAIAPVQAALTPDVDWALLARLSNLESQAFQLRAQGNYGEAINRFQALLQEANGRPDQDLDPFISRAWMYIGYIQMYYAMEVSGGRQSDNEAVAQALANSVQVFNLSALAGQGATAAILLGRGFARGALGQRRDGVGDLEAALNLATAQGNEKLANEARAALAQFR